MRGEVITTQDFFISSIDLKKGTLPITAVTKPALSLSKGTH